MRRFQGPWRGRGRGRSVPGQYKDITMGTMQGLMRAYLCRVRPCGRSEADRIAHGEEEDEEDAHVGRRGV